MSTYNRGAVVSDAIESILNQTETDFEFILIDDGSTDNTADVLKEYAKKDNRIRVLTNKTNKGLIYSLNRGLKAAHGQFIARMDDDDISLPWRFERQLAAMEAYPDITVFGTNLTNATSNPPHQTGKPLIENPALTEIHTYYSSGLGHPSIMMRRDFLKRHNIMYRAENLYAEDCGLYAEILDNGGKLSVVKEPLLRFSVARGIRKPDGYAYTQQDTFKIIQRHKLEKLFGTEEDFTDLLGSWNDLRNKCRLFNKMASANRDKKILDQAVLEQMIAQKCPDDYENALLVNHPLWEDFFVFESKNRIRRQSEKSRATIINETPDTLTIKWDLYGTEKFKKISDKEIKHIN